MQTSIRRTLSPSRRAPLVLAVVLTSLLVPLPASAADAPGRCSITAASAQGTWLPETIASSTDVDWFRFDKAFSGHALVTLGDLPADYDLYLYAASSCSTPIASSRRSGRTYDEIYRSLAAGRYFVKVVGYAGASSATARYVVRFRPLAESAQVLSTRAPWTDSAGYIHVAGEVLNNTASARGWIQLNTTLYNSANTAVGSGVGYTDVATLRPRTRSPFEIVIRKPATYHHAAVSVARSSVVGTPVGGLAVTSGQPYTDAGGARHFPGTVKNTNAGSVKLTQVVTTLYDARGAVRGLGWSFASPSTIASGASARFDVKASGTATPNRVTSQAQGRLTGCYATPRYATAGSEDFKPTATLPATINRSSAYHRVALTFDMGGRMDPAVAILNRLVAYRVCATIFPTGAISKTPGGQAALAIVKAHPELFELGNHTMHHCDLVRGGGGAPGSAEAAYCAGMPTSGTAWRDFVKKELTDGEAWIRQYTGRTTKPFWRAPYGSYNSTVRTWAAEAGWTKHFKWDVDTIDWKPLSDGGPSARAMTLKVVDNARSGSVVLMHLGGYETLDALPGMIDGLRSRGFILTTLSDMVQ